MIGAVIGDIAGSRFEFNNIKTKDFALFHPDCGFTDDTVMSLAVAKALLEAETENGFDLERLPFLTVRCMQSIGREYPFCGYGGRFRTWMFTEDPKPYGSYGNGSAMRISPVGFAAGDAEEAKRLSRAVTAVSHDHPEGIKGAEATAVAIVLAREGKSKEEIRKVMEENYYASPGTLKEIRPSYRFNEICQETLPQALQCFYEGEDFEDVIRNAVSLGGDSDTLGAIAGAVAEAYYGVPAELREKAVTYLDQRLAGILNAFEEKYGV